MCIDILRQAMRAFRRTVYVLRRRQPWRYGYIDYKEHCIAQELAKPELLNRFTKNEALPEGYGPRLDERLVEFPWLLTHLPEVSGRVLDAGSTINHRYIMDHSVWKNKDITIMTLAPEAHSFWQRKISYVWGDLREVPFRDNWFDVITCISTLEHVGMDNAIYTRDSTYHESNQASYLKVIAEFKRILKPGGLFYLTVPYGKYKQCGFQQVFNHAMLQGVIDHFGGSVVEQTFFRYQANGWQRADQADCEEADYFNIHATPDYEADYAAAARAVACLIIRK